jgi:uncharacterized protein (DUF4415 family)
MSDLHFEWDFRKAVANATKHGVGFEGHWSFAIAIAKRAMSFESFQPGRRQPGNRSSIRKGGCMRKEYDFSSARKNPYASQLKKQITIRLDEDAIDYFKSISEEVGIPYQSLINLYLRDCAATQRKLNLNWK